MIQQAYNCSLNHGNTAADSLDYEGAFGIS